MSEIKSIISTEPEKTASISSKLDFDGVDAVHDALCYAFYPDGIGEEEDIDDKFMSLWCLFLVSAGWSEDEYWTEYHNRPQHCHECGEELDVEGRHLDEDDEQLELPMTVKSNDAANKPN